MFTVDDLHKAIKDSLKEGAIATQKSRNTARNKDKTSELVLAEILFERLKPMVHQAIEDWIEDDNE